MNVKYTYNRDSSFQLTDQDLRKIQKTIASKFQERKQIVQKINQKLLCKKVFEKSLNHPNESYFVYNKKTLKAGELQAVPQKPLKSLNIQQTNKEQLKEVFQVQSKIKDRNKRVLGGLNNYLRSAQKNIQSQAAKNKSKSQIINKVLQKERNQTENLLQKKFNQIQDQIQQLINKKNQNADEMRKLQNLMLKTQYLQYANNLQHFLFTKTQPTIAWKCNHNFKKSSQGMKNLKNLKTQSEEKIEKLKEKVAGQIMMYDTKFQFQKYMIQNQKQYLSNYLNHTFNHLSKNFFMTKTQPQIAWKPFKMSEQLQKVKEQSDACFLKKQISQQERITRQNVQHQALIQAHHQDHQDLFDFDQQQQFDANKSKPALNVSSEQKKKQQDTKIKSLEISQEASQININNNLNNHKNQEDDKQKKKEQVLQQNQCQ